MKKILFALAILMTISLSGQTHASTETSGSEGSGQSTAEQQVDSQTTPSQTKEEDDPSFLERLLDDIAEELRSWEFSSGQCLSIFKS